MAITLHQLSEHAYTTLGETFDQRITSRSDVREVVNDAGRYLVNMHAWTWRHRPSATLDFVADQAYVQCPADFGEMTAFESATTSQNVRLASINQILLYRSGTAGTSFNTYAALVWPSQTTSKVPPGRPRFELWPTPASSTAGAINLSYRATWAELDDGDDVANIPLEYTQLLIRMVRAHAVYLISNDDGAIDMVDQSTMAQRLKDRDGRTQGNLGPITYGMDSDEAFQQNTWTSAGL